MTQAELVSLCKSLGFCGEPDRCVKGSYYADLNHEKYTGPTLIYQPVNDTKVYISPEIHIERKPHIFGGIHKLYAYDGIKYKNRGFHSMRENYAGYELTNDEQIKHALFDLQKQWKSEMNRLREEGINGDFK